MNLPVLEVSNERIHNLYRQGLEYNVSSEEREGLQTRVWESSYRVHDVTFKR